jgi:hypothetical protein
MSSPLSSSYDDQSYPTQLLLTPASFASIDIACIHQMMSVCFLAVLGLKICKANQKLFLSYMHKHGRGCPVIAFLDFTCFITSGHFFNDAWYATRTLSWKLSQTTPSKSTTMASLISVPAHPRVAKMPLLIGFPIRRGIEGIFPLHIRDAHRVCPCKHDGVPGKFQANAVCPEEIGYTGSGNDNWKRQIKLADRICLRPIAEGLWKSVGSLETPSRHLPTHFISSAYQTVGDEIQIMAGTREFGLMSTASIMHGTLEP